MLGSRSSEVSGGASGGGGAKAAAVAAPRPQPPARLRLRLLRRRRLRAIGGLRDPPAAREGLAVSSSTRSAQPRIGGGRRRRRIASRAAARAGERQRVALVVVAVGSVAATRVGRRDGRLGEERSAGVGEPSGAAADPDGAGEHGVADSGVAGATAR